MSIRAEPVPVKTPQSIMQGRLLMAKWVVAIQRAAPVAIAVPAMARELLRLRKFMAVLCLNAQTINVTARQRIETRLRADSGIPSGSEDTRSRGLKNMIYIQALLQEKPAILEKLRSFERAPILFENLPTIKLTNIPPCD
jgi:hypothetical protein